MKIGITGGAGYVGSRLVPFLLHHGHHVSVLDTFWYGDRLEDHPNLRKIKGDIRSRNDLRDTFRGKDAVIHMACVSNDPSFDMNPGLGKSINYDCFQDILGILREQKVERFIYASSSSVYGVSDLKDVTEDAPKNPITDYSKYKLACENELKTYGAGATWTILRPATVCGYAPRVRLDLVVNVLTINALVNKKITLFGRDQKRPNINIRDMVRAYDFVLNASVGDIDQQTYNVGYENLSLWEIADMVRTTLGDPDIEIVERQTNDPRSYHVNSDKFSSLGFVPTWRVKEAIRSIDEAFKGRLLIDPMNNSNYYNIKKMKDLKL